jgi:16S rRNA processing protein RimM
VKRKLPAKPDTNQSARRTREHLVAGRIVRPHGVRGQVVVEPTSELIERLQPGQALRLQGSGRTTRLVSLQPHQTRYLATLEGYSTREAAETLRGETIECPIEDIGPLPDGVYFRWEIIGLRAVTDDGAELGEIVDVFSTGANDVYEVLRADGTRVLLPAISSVVLGIDLEGGQARIHLLPGLIDPA